MAIHWRLTSAFVSYLPANTREIGLPEQIIRVEREVMPPADERIRATQLLDVMEIQYVASLPNGTLVCENVPLCTNWIAILTLTLTLTLTITLIWSLVTMISVKICYRHLSHLHRTLLKFYYPFPLFWHRSTVAPQDVHQDPHPRVFTMFWGKEMALLLEKEIFHFPQVSHLLTHMTVFNRWGLMRINTRPLVSHLYLPLCSFYFLHPLLLHDFCFFFSPSPHPFHPKYAYTHTYTHTHTHTHTHSFSLSLSLSHT